MFQHSGLRFVNVDSVPLNMTLLARVARSSNNDPKRAGDENIKRNVAANYSVESSRELHSIQITIRYNSMQKRYQHVVDFYVVAVFASTSCWSRFYSLLFFFARSR